MRVVVVNLTQKLKSEARKVIKREKEQKKKRKKKKQLKKDRKKWCEKTF